MIEVPISLGELFDKIAILQIKLERVADDRKRANVRFELETLLARSSFLLVPPRAEVLIDDLASVNRSLWDIEDELRRLERNSDFGCNFVRLARSVYIQNDRRARLKREISVALNSGIVDEKLYAEY